MKLYIGKEEYGYKREALVVKKREYAHWKKTKCYQGVLLFAQTIEECTFPYSFESYKAPALNCHYLCYDISYTVRDIEAKVLMDGNFVPLAEEFEQMLNDDLFIGRMLPDRGALLLTKNKNADYYDLTQETLAAKIKNYPEVAQYIKDLCETQDIYTKTLLEIICENADVEVLTQENKFAIYWASRMYVSELVNYGYSKQYVYSCVEKMFFDPQKAVASEIEDIVNFFNCFLGDVKTYKVVFGVNKKAAFLFDRLDEFEVSIPTKEEKALFNRYKNGDRVITAMVESLDPYAAFELASKRVEKIISVHKINQHDSRLYISNKGYVALQKENGEYEDSIVIYAPQNLMKRKGNTSDMHAFIKDFVFLDKIEPPSAFYRAVALHNGAIESSDLSNQLLNLWTIIEVLISSKRDNEDRINTICSILCSVLNRSYMYSCLEQLLHDIDVCTGKTVVDGVLAGIGDEGEEIDPTEKFALLLSLQENSEALQKVLGALDDYPLLVYRVKFYSEEVLRTSKTIYDFLKRHEKRVRWHIMRIYRNRNMIVHNGSYMPYVDTIAENLHFYVDELLDVLIEYYHVGIANNASIYKNIEFEEVSYFGELGVQVTKPKAKQTEHAITKENALRMIFNGYDGKKVQKAIEAALRKRDEESE